LFSEALKPGKQHFVHKFCSGKWNVYSLVNLFQINWLRFNDQHEYNIFADGCWAQEIDLIKKRLKLLTQIP